MTNFWEKVPFEAWKEGFFDPRVSNHAQFKITLTWSRLRNKSKFLRIRRFWHFKLKQIVKITSLVHQPVICRIRDFIGWNSDADGNHAVSVNHILWNIISLTAKPIFKMINNKILFWMKKVFWFELSDDKIVWKRCSTVHDRDHDRITIPEFRLSWYISLKYIFMNF